MTPTVIVVGSINVDLVTQVDELPAPGETVIGGTFVQTHGGKGANQAVAAARAGARVQMIGMLGEDDLGRAARDELDADGVSTTYVGTTATHTGVAQILVGRDGENLIAVASGANLDLEAATVERSLAKIEVDDAVVLSVLEVPDGAVLAAGRAARDRGWRFVLNPAPAKPLSTELLELCDVLIPNEHEVGSLGADTPQELLERGSRAVIVTRGARGADLVVPGGTETHVAAFDVTPVDTTGAGDTFSGALAVALGEGRDLEKAVTFASAAAAISTEKVGARVGMPRRAAIEDLVATRESA